MTTNNIVSFAARTKRPDPCAEAAARLANADNDVLYDNAAVGVARLPATTLAGIRAKWDALCLFLDHVEAGGELLPDGIDELRALRETLGAALSPPKRKAN